MTFDKEKETAGKELPSQSLNVKNLSQFFYQKSSLVLAVFLTAILVGYLLLVMMSKAAGFELADNDTKSLGTSFGFDQADIIAFLAARTDEMIRAYINFNQVWDALFGLIYGLMYVVWVSVLFKPLSQKAGFINLIPFAQVLFDWFENFTLVVLANQYLADGMISSSNAQMASVFSMIKWVCSGLTFTLILIGIILMIARAVTSKNRHPF